MLLTSSGRLRSAVLTSTPQINFEQSAYKVSQQSMLLACCTQRHELAAFTLMLCQRQLFFSFHALLTHYSGITHATYPMRQTMHGRALNCTSFTTALH